MFTPQIEPRKQAWIKPKKPKSEKNMYTSLKCVLICSQFMGLLPLANITKGPDNIGFKWANLRVLCSLFIIVLQGCAMLFCAAFGFEKGFNLSIMADQTFYICGLGTMILYFHLARGWSEFVTKWCNVDQIMNKTYGYPKRIDLWIKSYLVLFFVLGIYHGLSLISRYTSLTSIHKENYTAAYYYNKTFPELFYHVNYSLPLGIYTSVVVTHSNLCRAFNDLFIILLSMMLASRFNQVSDKIKKEHATVKSVQFWEEIRLDYDRLCNLCVDLNNNISLMLLLSYFENIVFILVQLFNSLIKNFPRTFEKIYFIYSSCYLLFKTISVSLHASSINDASKKPALYLNNVPSKGYNLEIKRLLTQISFDNVFLTGCQMFKITRGLVLSIAMAIVAYELLLIQLTSYLRIDDKKDDQDDDGVH